MRPCVHAPRLPLLPSVSAVSPWLACPRAPSSHTVRPRGVTCAPVLGQAEEEKRAAAVQQQAKRERARKKRKYHAHGH